MPTPKHEKKNAITKLVWITMSNFTVSLTILSIQEYYPTSFLLFLLFVGYQECIQGIVLPILFINNTPNLKFYVLDKFTSSVSEIITTSHTYSRTIYDNASSFIQRRENQIDVIV